MALELSLGKSQSNDAITLTLTDTAGTYHAADNPTGWGGGTYEVANIVASTDTTTSSKYHLLLDLTVTDKNGDSTSYDQINLYDHNGGSFTDTGDLTWDFTPADFDVSGTSMGAATDKLDDGVYVFIYQLVLNSNHSTVYATLTEGFIVDGDVKIELYDMLRQVPDDYDNEALDKSKDILDALVAKSYYDGILAYSIPESNTTRISTMLYTLDKMISDGSKYTW